MGLTKAAQHTDQCLFIRPSQVSLQGWPRGLNARKGELLPARWTDNMKDGSNRRGQWQQSQFDVLSLRASHLLALL